MGIRHLVAWLKGIYTRAKDWRFLKLLRHQVIITLGAFFVFSKPLLSERFSLNGALLLCNYVRELCTAHLSLLLKTSDAFFKAPRQSCADFIRRRDSELTSPVSPLLPPIRI